MSKTLRLSIAALFVSGCVTLLAQTPETKAERAAENTRTRAKAAASDKDVTYGRIKELTPGQKIVINVDNRPDKTFELSDKDVTVKLAKGLKVGDPVKVEEHDTAGKTHSVAISKHTGGGVKHGETNPVTK